MWRGNDGGDDDDYDDDDNDANDADDKDVIIWRVQHVTMVKHIFFGKCQMPSVWPYVGRGGEEVCA